MLSQLYRTSVLTAQRSVVQRHFSAVGANAPVIEALVRSNKNTGSSKSRSLRSKQRQIPGVVYGVDEDRNVVKILVQVPKNVLDSEIRRRGMSFENTIYNIAVKDEDGNETRHLITPRQAQFSGVNNELLAVNYLKYQPGNVLRIPIKFVNEELSTDLKRGCLLIRVKRFIECVCDGEVPQYIECDVGETQKGDVLRLNRLSFPDRVRPARNVPEDQVFCIVKAMRGK